MIGIYYFFAGLLVLSSLKSLIDGIAYLRSFRSETSREPDSEYQPFATVIVPFRGVDPGLEENLSALFRLDYAEYELLFVTDKADDPSVAVINAAITAAASFAAFREARLVIAPAAVHSSQKVENLREAVLHARSDSQVFAFADSDARVSPRWLRALVEPLVDPKVGASTGYRWFIAGRSNLAGELRSAWNASIASALGTNRRSNFCWGGSMAFRRDTFERLQLRDRWAGTLSDDFAATRVLREAALDIAFVPMAMAATVENCSFRELFEFTTRQMKITRVYMPQLWAISLVGSVLYVAVMAASIAIAFGSYRSLPRLIAMSVLGLVLLLGTAKAYVRLRAIRLALPRFATGLARQSVPQLLLWSVTPIIFLHNSLAAAFSRRIRWRSTVYELKSPAETVIIAD